MVLTLKRLRDNGKSTIGELTVDDLHFWTMEDSFHPVKIYGQTRIPEGEYEIILRTDGLMHNLYKNRVPGHKGMLWLQDVPGFKFIYIHIGNTAADSSGCVLVGSRVVDDDFIAESTIAYLKLYRHVLDAIEKGEQVKINIS